MSQKRKGPTLRCLRFTPAEAAIDRGKCLARTWNHGKGGQCDRYPSAKYFCPLHSAGGEGEEQWRVFGHVLGPIPEDKLQLYEHYGQNRTSEKVDLAVWRKRKLISREDAENLERSKMTEFLKNSGYTNDRWRKMQKVNSEDEKAVVVDFLMLEQSSDLWTEVGRLQRHGGEARARELGAMP
mmetsp:Transcript_28844/g.43673  ORF Transcript_28844/g.43673 Transcript_28844/m.43673 type:complete len:182 (+) Transcript_28844:81-626(+)